PHVHVMELLKGGELLGRLRKKKFFTETEAVEFLHSRGVNLLFEDNSDKAELKIVDFGFAALNPKNETMMTPCFTLPYSAPEVLKQITSRKDGYNESCDLWSLGVILYSMLSGKAPFQESGEPASALNIMQRIKEGEFDLSGPEWADVSNSAKQLIRGLLTVEPKKRLRMHDLLRHKWLRKNMSNTPLRTPGVLNSHSNVVQDQINNTMEAFHQATRDGFRLQEVATAPLAKRRKQKKNSVDTRSSSTDSNNSSSTTSSHGAAQSPARQSPVRAISRNSSTSSISQSSVCSTGFVPTTLNISPSPLASSSLSKRATPEVSQGSFSGSSLTPSSAASTSSGIVESAPFTNSPFCAEAQGETTPLSVIHIPSVDGVGGGEEPSVDRHPFTAKGKRAKKNTNNNSIPPFRLTRGFKRKMDEKADHLVGNNNDDDNNDHVVDDDCDEDCVIVEKNYPSPRHSRSAFKRLKSETIVID
ncbi:unnamed protein product, partial [Candidula unifasciata]